MSYEPQPVDLSDIVLNEPLRSDLETVARNIHETWAKERILHGWGYGDEYDRKHKRHPCLIAYDALPEIEKDMDRATVTQAVKMLLYMGYSIEKRSGKGGTT